MARGGGTVAGSKHSVENEKHSSGGGGGGDADPKCVAFILFIGAVVFLICAIAIPVALVADPPGDSCSPAQSVNVKEQAVCVPTDYEHNWIVDTDSNGPKYVKVYKVGNQSAPTHFVNFTWKNYYAKLKGSYDYFAFSIPLYGEGYFNVYCDGKKKECEKLKLYFLNSKQFAKAVDSDGEFHDDKYNPSFKDFEKEGWNSFHYWAYGPEYYYLVFSNAKSKKAEILYDILMYNKIYDTTGMTAEKFDGTRVKVTDLKKGELVVAEFPTDATEAEAESKDVQWVDIKMHNDRVSLGAAVAVGVIFGLLAIVCGVIGVVYILKWRN